jgi:hypothetical protein
MTPEILPRNGKWWSGSAASQPDRVEREVEGRSPDADAVDLEHAVRACRGLLVRPDLGGGSDLIAGLRGARLPTAR